MVLPQTKEQTYNLRTSSKKLLLGDFSQAEYFSREAGWIS